jgi:uncharacterized protein YdeI (YjbR/CyaY-like superfamily)
MKIEFFPTPSHLRKWFEKNHLKKTELFVGFYKKDSGKPSITWTESVREALCYGWIDGIRKSIDDKSYFIRFTPRKQRSIWSAININHAEELSKLGLMHENGLAAFNKREYKRSKIYSFEQKNVAFDEEFEKQFRKNKKAWKLFQAFEPSYKKTATWWVISAKQEETRQRRLATLIKDSEEGIKLKQLRRN